MIMRFVIALFFSAFIQNCGAETISIPSVKNNVVPDNLIIEKTLTDFSTALSRKNLSLLLTITDPKNIYLVRLFTSGNLGGRGSPLSQSTSSNSINKDLAFDIKKQTPFELLELFTNLPIKSVKALPHRALVAEADTAHFDQWPPILKKSLTGAPEVAEGDSLLLHSSKYWVYTEAQIIDDLLVGGFAVFEMQGGKLKFVALMDLL